MTQEQEPGTKAIGDRIDHKGPLAPVIIDICNAYSVGDAVGFSTIYTGYEDYNVDIVAQNGEYVAKIFASDIDDQTIARYSEIMANVMAAGVNHPSLLKTKNGQYVHRYNENGNLSMVLMDYIEGKTFGELGLISRSDITEVLRQASIINNIDYKPSYVNDTWAVQNIESLSESVTKYLPLEEQNIVAAIVGKFKNIPIETLPHCFVHGDLHKANLIKGDDGKIYPIDFSVSNYYPRIQELAVISANLLHNNKYGKTLKNITLEVADIYGRFNPLTKEEKENLYVYTLAVKTMTLLGGYKEKFINGQKNAETEEWINGASQGLKRELMVK